MPPQLIRFHGTYRYPSLATLDRALSCVRAQLDDEDLADHALAPLRSFIKSGASLRIDILLPALAELRFIASDVFQILARDAVEGAVEASHGTRHVDFFPSGGEE